MMLISFVYFLFLFCCGRSTPFLSISSRQTCPVILPAQPPLESSPSTRDASFNSRIAGGAPANLELTKLIAVVYDKVNNAHCTGVLVAEDIVLTGGHGCLTEGNSSRFTVYMGQQKASSFSEIPKNEAYEVIKVVIHPRDESDIEDNNEVILSYSVGFLILERAVSGVTPLSVNKNPSIPEEGSVIRAIGYGRFEDYGDDKNSSNPDGELHQVDIPIAPRQKCVNDYKDVGIDISEGVFCYGYENRSECRNCGGDGPLIQYDDNQNPVLIGVFAGFPVGCTDAKYPNLGSSSYLWYDLLEERSVQFVENTQCVQADSTLCSSGLSSVVIGVISGVAALLVIIAIVIAIFCFLRRRRRKQQNNTTGGKVGENQPEQNDASVEVGTPPSGYGPSTSTTVPSPGVTGTFLPPQNSQGFSQNQQLYLPPSVEEYQPTPGNAQVTEPTTPPSGGAYLPPQSHEEVPQSQNMQTSQSPPAGSGSVSPPPFSHYQASAPMPTPPPSGPMSSMPYPTSPPPASIPPAYPGSAGTPVSASPMHAFQNYDPYQTNRAVQSPFAPQQPSPSGAPAYPTGWGDDQQGVSRNVED